MSSDRHKVIPRVMCFIFNDDKSEVVLMKAAESKDFAGKYDPPGGHIEKGDSVIEAAVREIIEETGLEPKNTCLRGIIHVSNFFGKEIMLFITECTANKKRLVEHREGTPEWIDLEDLENIPLIEDVRPILEKLLELNPEELLIGTSEFDGKDKIHSFSIAVY